MQIDLLYVHQPAGKTHYRYRRKVPVFLREAMGKTEIILPLGRTPTEVMQHYPKAHKQAEAELKAAMRGQSAVAKEKTPLERYQWATRQVADWRLNDYDGSYSDPPGLTEQEEDAQDALAGQYDERQLVAEQILEGRLPGGTNLSEADKAALVRSLMLPGRKPEPTLGDAIRLYLAERVAGTHDETKKRQRVERVRQHVEKALGRDPRIAGLTRANARQVRDEMLAGGEMAPATVHRYLNDLRAIITLAIKELDLGPMVNPFNGLEVKKETLAKEDRKPFTDKQLAAARDRVLGHASPDLQRVWRILEMTGCRLAEVTGLLVDDVHLDGLPYIDLRVHPHRRLKNVGSVRWVPLVGDALSAAREAVSANTGPGLFGKYAHENGPAAASQALMKHVRRVVSDPKVTVHSLRHTIKDKLIRARITANEQDFVLGHSSGAESESYGGPASRLEAATEALKKALGVQ